ncbi:MAG: NGG1p interacting factor NIF3 [Patescibacteria group bacterium]|nr:NGG1p interacting factor NIF3 [Patescibacteria group bacterium]
MTVRQIFDLGIKLGIENDFRSKKEIDEYLKKKKEEFKELKGIEKDCFDKEKLINPYSDSRIHFDNGKKTIKKVLAGIDITMGGLLLAKELDFDLVINHHPIGSALANLDDVMEMQIDYMESIGVPVTIAEKLLHKRISEVSRGINPGNHQITIDAARLLNINLINIHTPADNMVAKFLTDKIAKLKPKYVGDVLKMLHEIEEYQEAKKQGVGPKLFTGNPKNRCGKVVASEITGGAEGSPDLYEALSNSGVGTVVGMHQSEQHRKAADKAHINVIIAGHISSDSIGMNLFLDELEKKGLKVTAFSGLIRVPRIKKNNKKR